MSIVEIDGLTKLYKNGKGVRDITLNIEKGQIYGLLGPNGSGKTTTMKAMTGLLQPDSGGVRLFGHNPNEDMLQAMADTGCIIESPSMYAYMTGRQNMEIISRLYPGCKQAAIQHNLERLGLSARQDDKVEKYSLGMKQRLGLAMTLLPSPELLILDEPSNGLDIEGMALVREIILEQAAQGKTMLVSSHLAGELEQVCTHVAVIMEGALLATAAMPGLLEEYGSLEKYYLSLVKNCGCEREEELAS